MVKLTPNHHPVNKEGLVLWCGYMNNGSVSASGTCKDYSGNGNDGVMVGNTFIDSNGANFDGTGDYINYGRPASLSNMNTGTVSMWVKLSSLSGERFIFGRDIAGPNNGDLNINANFHFINKWTFQAVSGGTDRLAVSDDNITLNWVYIVGTWDGTTIKMYIDGVLQTTTASLSTDVMTVASDITLGSLRPSSTSEMAGEIDNFQIYNRALSAGEVKLNYLKNMRA